MLKLEKVNKIYQTDRIETQALANVNVHVERGEFVSVMGPSGCGKTTMLNIMGLLDAPTDGRITVAGEEICSYQDQYVSEVRNRTLGFIFQSFHLINDLTVRDNVEVPLLYRKTPAKERRKLAQEALERVGLESRMDHFPTALSGGQQQRVAIARAIVGRPQLLLADEPTGNLDSHMGNEIMEILKKLNTEQDTTIVMVTHDKGMADRTDRLIRVFDGQIVA